MARCALKGSFLAVVLCWAILPLAAKYDSDLKWQTLKTEHFYIHYHQGNAKLAQKIAALAEKKYPQMTKKIGHVPFFRTHLVVSDIADDANGSATPYPWNRVELTAAKPLPGDILGNYGDWDNMLFSHEYTHTLNIDQIGGLPSLSRYILGRIWFPNAEQPLWIIEGSAVAEESAEGLGRNNSSVVEMYFRTAAEGDSLKSINRASAAVRGWPAGHIYYFYGGRFIAWLKKKYPDKNFHDIHRENADNIWPYLNNTNARDVFGAAFTDLWEEWLQELGKEQSQRLQEIRRAGVTPLTRLTEADFYQTFPRFDATGKTLYYLNENNYSRPSLQRLQLLEKKGPQKSSALNAPAFLTMNGNEPHVIDTEFYRSFSLHKDVFTTTDRSQLTDKLRAVSIDYTKDDKMLAVTQSAGEFTLGLYDKKGTLLKKIVGPTVTTLSHARLSADGKSAVFSAKERDRAATHLYLAGLENGDITQLTEGDSTDIHPAFNADATKVIFSSDRGGVYNIHELSLEKKEQIRLTNVTGGLFYPDVSPDGKSIAVSEFTDKGYRIALYDRSAPAFEKQTVAFRKAAPTDLTVTHADTVVAEPHGYSVFPSILPSFWLPTFGYSTGRDFPASLGFALFGADALQRDFFGFAFSQDIYAEISSFGFAYENQRYYPDFYIAPFFSVSKHCDSFCRVGGDAGVRVPFLKYFTRHFFYANGSYDLDRRLNIEEITGLIGYSFSNTQLFSRSVSPENGRAIGISASIERNSFLDYPRVSYTLADTAVSYAEYLPGFFRNHVTMARVYWTHSHNIDNRITIRSHRTPYSYNTGPFLRGYGSTYFGQGLVLGTLEYRFPIYQPDWGFFRVPVFFKDFYGKLFMDAGKAYYSIISYERPWQVSAGAEIGLNSVFGYRYPWSAYIGYARGFNEYGEHQVYFGVLGFTGVLWAKYSPHSEYR